MDFTFVAPSKDKPSLKSGVGKLNSESIQRDKIPVPPFKKHERAMPDCSDCPTALATGRLGDVLAASSLCSTCSLKILD